MKSILITYFLFINMLVLVSTITCDASEPQIIENRAVNKCDFLDIIIDDTHAYTHLSYIDSYGFRHSLYSSLMPKSDASEKNVEGIERFPIILESLLREENTSEYINDNSELIDSSPEKAVLTLKELISAFCFSIYYMFSDYLNTTDIGEIISKKPIHDQIKMQRRFYLTPEQARKAKAVINKSFLESSKGKIVYDIMTYNCVDYAEEIYKAIGLDKIRGDFLNQFDFYCNNSDDGKGDSPFSILKLYKAHTEGDLGPARVLKVLCNAVKMLKLRGNTTEGVSATD